MVYTQLDKYIPSAIPFLHACSGLLCDLMLLKNQRTLCFSRSSLLKGALMMVRRSLEGALKCALRDFRREQVIAISEEQSIVSIPNFQLPHPAVPGRVISQ